MAPLFRVALLSSLSLLFAPFSFAAVNNVTNRGLAPPVTRALTFASSDWIWTSTAKANAFVALRKDFTPPLGKALIAAEILIDAENMFTLYVNGDLVGSAAYRINFAYRFCVDLLPSYNVFAVNASTVTTDGALLASILLTYSDGTTDTLVSDSTWRVNKGLPIGFEQLSFDDTAWPGATVVAGSAPEFIPSVPPVVDLEHAEWVWTDVVPASGKVPASQRAFRRTFIPAPGQVPASATIIITADNQYTLYVNGATVGNGTSSKVAQRYTINFATPASEVVLAVLATNNVASPAGVLVAMEINMQPTGRTNCTAGAYVLTDARLTAEQWKSPKGAIPDGFERPGFDDSAWPVVVSEEVYAVGPTWGTVTISPLSTPVTI
ncbi:hypothetical protein B0H14DRAFT_2611071 [Mycena olivaceomarginata]|nr:hypothetical protein B0H14DRAFT_3530202 [Mycena olivaceomarginata]KAJ7805718.1 hypothetical protein B0H14DRAFT_2611071 [Mycena olivaceomarginata]